MVGCSQADGGGGSRVSWGAMVFGGFKFLKGAAAAAKYEEWKSEDIEVAVVTEVAEVVVTQLGQE